MPEFAPGVEKTARVPMSNPTAKAFDYTAELYMGVNLARKSKADFHLEAGESKDIDMPVVMPTEPGTYPVYIGVFSAGENIGLYQATDVVITIPLANLYGTVIDGEAWPYSRIPVADVEITMDGWVTYSNSKGEFAFEGFPAGNYVMHFIKEGYKYGTIYKTLREGNNEISVVMVPGVSPELPPSPPDQVFSFGLPSVTTMTNELAPAWRVAQVSCLISNPTSKTTTRYIECCWAYAESPESLHCDRAWDGPTTMFELTLRPWDNYSLVSPAYYMELKHKERFSNAPNIGKNKRFWYCFRDDLGNVSPKVLA